jgi:hypothetical protein
MKTYDPQIIVEAELKAKNPDAPELLVFSIPLVFFEITCICPIPPEGTKSKVYVKFRIDKRGAVKTSAAIQALVAASQARYEQHEQGDVPAYVRRYEERPAHD